MRNVILLGALVLLTLQVLAQTSSKSVDIIFEKQVKKLDNCFIIDIVGYDSTGIYLQQSWTRDALEHYDNQLNLTNKSFIRLSQPKMKKMGLEFIIQSADGGLYQFTSFKEKKKTKSLFVQKIDKQTLRAGDDLLKIAEVDYTGEKRLGIGYRHEGVFEYEQSRDRSKTLVYYKLTYGKRDQEKIALFVLDQNMNLLWSKEKTLPYDDKWFDMVDYNVDNKGNVYLIGKLFGDESRDIVTDKDKLEKGEVDYGNYQHQVISLFDNGSKEVSYSVQLPSKYIKSMGMTIDNNQDVFCGGVYTNNKLSDITKGTYFLKIDSQSGELLHQTLKGFDNGLVTLNETGIGKKRQLKRASKDKYEGYQYLTELIPKEDGGYFLVLEQFAEELKRAQTTNGSLGSVYFEKYHDDVFVAGVSPSAEIQWNQKISKAQNGGSGNFLASGSYFASVEQNKLFMVYNGNLNNFLPEKTKKLKKGEIYRYQGYRDKNATVVLATIDNQGKLEKKPLLETKKKRSVGIIRPWICEQISPNEVVLLKKVKKKYSFLKMELKNASNQTKNESVTN